MRVNRPILAATSLLAAATLCSCATSAPRTTSGSSSQAGRSTPGPTGDPGRAKAPTTTASTTARSEIGPSPKPSASRLSPPPRAASPSAAHEVSGKIGSAPDRLPAASGSGAFHVASGAPSDAQVRAELAQARAAGVVPPAGNSVQSFEQGATYTYPAQGSYAFPIEPLSAVLGPETTSLA